MDAWAFALVVAVAVLEIALSLRWSKVYFSSGIRVFHRELPLQNPGVVLPTAIRLEDRLFKSPFPPLLFRQLDTDSLGFREKAGFVGFRFGYTPVMHGLLRFDRPSARVAVTGFLNWFIVAFALAMALAAYSFHEFVFLYFLAGLVALIYAIQAKRFGQVAAGAREEWEAVARQGGET